MCSLLLTHPSAHTWSSGQPTLRRPGGSVWSPALAVWRFGALLKGLTSVEDNSCWSRDSNPQPWVASPTLYPLEPRLPRAMWTQQRLNNTPDSHAVWKQQWSDDFENRAVWTRHKWNLRNNVEISCNMFWTWQFRESGWLLDWWLTVPSPGHQGPTYCRVSGDPWSAAQVKSIQVKSSQVKVYFYSTFKNNRVAPKCCTTNTIQQKQLKKTKKKTF